MQAQQMFNSFRNDYLMSLWQHEVHEYQIDLRMGDSDKNKELLKLISEIDQSLVQKLLHLYMCRCKLKHSMAFL